jgi:hypothetical protein
VTKGIVRISHYPIPEKEIDRLNLPDDYYHAVNDRVDNLYITGFMKENFVDAGMLMEYLTLDIPHPDSMEAASWQSITVEQARATKAEAERSGEIASIKVILAAVRNATARSYEDIAVAHVKTQFEDEVKSDEKNKKEVNGDKQKARNLLDNFSMLPFDAQFVLLKTLQKRCGFNLVSDEEMILYAHNHNVQPPDNERI